MIGGLPSRAPLADILSLPGPSRAPKPARGTASRESSSKMGDSAPLMYMTFEDMPWPDALSPRPSGSVQLVSRRG